VPNGINFRIEDSECFFNTLKGEHLQWLGPDGRTSEIDRWMGGQVEM